MPEGSAVNQMFANIASRYDRANHFLSAGIDYYWRKKLVSLVKIHNPKKVVDLATGSGDVAFALKKALGQGTSVIGLDFCHPMLEQAEAKKAQKSYGQDIHFAFGDCLSLPLPDNSVDAITIAFGFRNLEDRAKGLAEMHRVLKPGGALFILEFTQPYPWFRSLYYFYLKKILPKIASFLTKRPDAYHYLIGSIENFPNRIALSQEIVNVGFTNVKSFPLTFSTVAIYVGVVNLKVTGQNDFQDNT